jgi:hypothetical protein
MADPVAGSSGPFERRRIACPDVSGELHEENQGNPIAKP